MMFRILGIRVKPYVDIETQVRPVISSKIICGDNMAISNRIRPYLDAKISITSYKDPERISMIGSNL